MRNLFCSSLIKFVVHLKMFFVNGDSIQSLSYEANDNLCWKKIIAQQLKWKVWNVANQAISVSRVLSKIVSSVDPQIRTWYALVRYLPVHLLLRVRFIDRCKCRMFRITKSFCLAYSFSCSYVINNHLKEDGNISTWTSHTLKGRELPAF